MIFFAAPQRFSMIFFAVLDSKNKYQKQCRGQNCNKTRQICRIHNTVCGIKQVYSQIEITRNCERNPHFVCQTVRSVHCKLNPQQAKIIFVAESATILWFSLLWSASFLWPSLMFWIPSAITENSVSLKILPKLGEFAESTTVFAESGPVSEIHKQIIRDVYN